MRRKAADELHVTELILQALETERGGIKVYTAAIGAACKDDLRRQWTGCLEETRRHEGILSRVCRRLDLDPEMQSPGREIVSGHSKWLVEMIESAVATGDSGAAQLIAAECVMVSETKDLLNWALIGQVSKRGKKGLADILTTAYNEARDDGTHRPPPAGGRRGQHWNEAFAFRRAAA